MPLSHDRVFERVIVDYVVRGGARISWGLNPLFAEPRPHHFQLQVGETANPQADDWQDVGAPVENTFYAVDPGRRAHGVVSTVHYRVVLTTATGMHTSPPAAGFGLLSPRDWLYAREIIRKEELRASGGVATDGWLLKRRRHGPRQAPADAKDPRTMVRDPLTGAVIRRQNDPETLGTGFEGGYYRPMPFRVEFHEGLIYDATSDSAGNVDEEATARTGRCLMIPQVNSRDVFIARGSDLRYAFGRIKIAIALRNVPLVGDPVELKQLPLADVLYNVDAGGLAYVGPDGRPEPLDAGPWFPDVWF
jgi:hypothetical protein